MNKLFWFVLLLANVAFATGQFVLWVNTDTFYHFVLFVFNSIGAGVSIVVLANLMLLTRKDPQ